MILTQRRGWIGIDIGARSVKLAQLVRQSGKLRLGAVQIVQRLAPWRENGGAAAVVRESADEIVTGLSLCGGFRGRAAASAMPRAACSLQTFSDAPPDNDERRAAIVRELALQYGGSPDSFVFDCWTNDFEGPDSDCALVLSSTDQWARRIAADHAAGGLACRVLDGAPFALARALELSQPGGSAAPQGVLDWGFSQATFCIVLRAQPVFVRELRGCALQSLFDVVCQRLAVTFDEAHRLLTAHGAPAMGENRPAASGPQQLVWTIVEEKLNGLVDELDRTLCYLETHRRRLVPQMLWLFGGGAVLPNIERFLHDAVDLEARRWTLGALEGAGSSQTPPPPLIGPAIALSSLAWSQQ